MKTIKYYKIENENYQTIMYQNNENMAILSAKQYTNNNNITTKVIEVKKTIGNNLKKGKCIYIAETNNEQLTLGLTIPEIKKAAEATTTEERIKIVFGEHNA